MILIYSYESHQVEGIIYGVVSAFLATLFTAINGKFVKSISSFAITKYEMIGACLTMFIVLLLQGSVDKYFFYLDGMDWIYLLVLGIICTSLAFILSVWVMKQVSPFTVSISLNMEPVYTILIVLIIDWYLGTEKEHMSFGFYIGGIIILMAIFVNAYLKRERKSIS